MHTVGINDFFMVEEQLSKYLFYFGILFQVSECISVASDLHPNSRESAPQIYSLTKSFGY